MAEEIKERARRQARRKQASAQSRESESRLEPRTSELTTYEELVAQYEPSFITLTSGFTFLVTPITPGDFFLAAGTPFLNFLDEQGIEVGDPKQVAHISETLDPQELTAFSLRDDVLEAMQAVVCRCVKSVNFVQKPWTECSKAKKEVPVDCLSLTDLIELFNAIMALSMPEQAVEDGQRFRDAGQGRAEEGVSAKGGSDRGEVRAETKPTAVSESQSAPGAISG